MKKMFWSIPVFASLSVFSYCNNTKELTAQTEALFRKNWRLTEVQGKPVADSINSSFEFTPGRLSGSAGCNRLSAGFTAGKKQTVKFSEATSTKMACPDERGALEMNFLDALSKSTHWDIKGSELWLGTSETTLIKLKSF